MKIDWSSEIPQWLILAGMLLAAAILWPYAPESIPVHWNLQGQVDRLGGKFEGLLLLPLVSLFLYALMAALPLIDPGRANYQSFRTAYLAIRLGLLFFLAALYAAMMLVAFGYPLKMNQIVAPAVGLLFLMLGNFMGKIRPNWFVGIRTPWTLSSRRSWNQTHRLGGWLFMLMGLAIALCGIFPSVTMLIIAGIVVVASLIAMMIYSYVVWRDDPEKLAAGSIVPAPDANEFPSRP